jgi:nucleotide-binding universal stress UspA family protein
LLRQLLFTADMERHSAMKILLATDGSPCSKAAVNELCTRPWPPDTEVKVLTVAHTRIPLIPDPIFFMYAAHEEAQEAAAKRAAQIVDEAATEIRERAPHLRVTAEVLQETPKKGIVEEAERWGADLILIGSHGYGPVKRFLLGSVSHAVALHAPCSVEIVRPPRPSSPAEKR